LAVIGQDASLGYGGAQSGIFSITYGTPWAYNTSYPPQNVIGDGWANTWADDDKTYIVHDDTSRWNDAATTSGIKISTISATDSTAVGTLVNDMPAWGGFNQNTGTPSASHKAQGLISIAGVLYALNWRLDVNWMTSGHAVFDGQLLKSTDHGQNWTPSPPATALPYASPMFPGYDIPYGFVQYGKNYTGTGPDNSATYVYSTVFVSGSAPAGTTLKLARVPVGNPADCVTVPGICRQNAADWQYWKGGDGMDPANWVSSVGSAAAVISGTDATGGVVGNSSGMQYLPRYRKYLYMAEAGLSATNWYLSSWICDHPWGPCNKVGGSTHFTTGVGFPTVMPKSLVNGGQQYSIVGSNSIGTCCGGTSTYTLYIIPVTITP
jgi:hypothetical protein